MHTREALTTSTKARAYPAPMNAPKALPKAMLEPLEVFSVMHGGAHTALGRIASLFALLMRALAPHHPYPGLYDAVIALLRQADSEAFDRAHLVFHLFLLKSLGYGLDLEGLSKASGPSYMQRDRKLSEFKPVKNTSRYPRFLKGFAPTSALVCPDYDMPALRQAEALAQHMVSTHLVAA